MVGRPVRIWINILLGAGPCSSEKKNDKNGAIWCILSVPKYIIMNLKSTILTITRGPLVAHMRVTVYKGIGKKVQL